MAAEVIVTDEAFPYLVAQRGALDVLKHDRPTWERRYRESLQRDFEDISPYLPDRCDWLLDVGGGMGGIDILLSRHYDDPDLRIAILDGESDSPLVRRHAETFSNTRVAAGFLRANGVRPAPRFVRQLLSPERGMHGAHFSLTLSLQAWCFHIEPGAYLRELAIFWRTGDVVILDVRNGKPDWVAALEVRLEPVGIIRSEAKYSRCVYAVR